MPALGQVAMLALGGWLAVGGHITLGTFVAFSAYLAQLVGPVRMLAVVLTVGQQARAGTERVLELIDTEPSLTDGTKELPADAPATVEFDDVSFGYDPGRPVLDGLSFDIRPGRPSPSSVLPAPASPPSPCCCPASTTSRTAPFLSAATMCAS
ncbi:hypothetical protein SHKM778_80880 [Streptomyces sp. KM77-8]|uniref:ABC transmembrane type-1 domain-containing protein n=1 Tax=Streptomyces haneummycinicus TaxID=3074435 RepID=A0AAT9HX47_9ACTN